MKKGGGESSDRPRIYTIGHSTRSLAQFESLLIREKIRQLVDVRTFPASRRYPHFNREALTASLSAQGILYRWMPELGGRRTPRRDSHNTAWKNAGFRGYADYMETREFREALDTLVEVAAADRTAIMCAEAVPWRCHRSLISDALIAREIDVMHILDAGTNPHALTKFAAVRAERVYYGAEPDLFAETN
jgi:uncharacterized protein (DUF488 family)